MSVSLEYASTTEVSPDVKSAVQAAAAKLNEPPTWWCEGINFFDAIGHEQKLTGSTSMFFGGGYNDGAGNYVKVDSADDDFMAARDARRIVDQLARWSVEHGVEWQLWCAGGVVGHITRGQSDGQLHSFLNELAETAADGRPGVEVASEAGERLARELDAKYRSRWP